MAESGDWTDHHYYGGAIKGGDRGSWYPNLWTWIIKELNIKSVLDIGCGEGHSTKFFHENGCEVLGIDGDPEAIAAGPIPEKIVCHDYCTGPYMPDKEYDLVWCCEFVEHVEEEFMQNFIGTFKSAKYILLTHAWENQGGHHHVNKQSVKYWLKQLSKEGFELLPELTLIAREKAGCNYFLRSGLLLKNKKRFSNKNAGGFVSRLLNFAR